MRVIGGEFRSRRLKTLRGNALRPTPDRLRETLFDVLAPELAGASFVDAYAGSGAVGIEALSRGAARAVFIEKSRQAVRIIQENVAALGLEGRAEVVHGEALKRLPMHTAEIVFLDPPYELERECREALRLLGESPPRLVVAQHASRIALPDGAGALRRTRVLKQGDNSLSFYRPRDRESNPSPAPG